MEPNDIFNDPPNLKFTFDNELANRRLILVDEQTSRTVDLHEGTNLVPLADLVATAAYYVVLDDDNVPYSHPHIFEKATLQQTKGEPSSISVRVKIVLGEGYFTTLPAGLLVHAVGESDKTRAQYCIFSWIEDEGNRVTAFVDPHPFEDMIHEEFHHWLR